MKTDQLLPAVRPFFEAFLTALDRSGLRYSVLETLRSQAVQDAYYAQGRQSPQETNRLRRLAGLISFPIPDSDTANYAIITNVKHSTHQDGIAADIVPVLENGKIPWDYGAYKELWATFGRLGMGAGLEWGGTWKEFLPCGLGWDPPHYQRKIT